MTQPELGSLTSVSFETLVQGQIESLGDQNHPTPDPYSPTFGRKIGRSVKFDYRDHDDGRRDFGEDWVTHTLMVDDKELVYAAKPNEPQRSELYVHEFSSYGLGVRTLFKLNDDGFLHKSRQTRFGTILGASAVDFSHPLSEEETEVVKAVVVAPLVSKAALLAITAVNDYEQAMAEDMQARQEVRNSALKKRLAQLERMRGPQVVFTQGHSSFR